MSKIESSLSLRSSQSGEKFEIEIPFIKMYADHLGTEKGQEMGQGKGALRGNAGDVWAKY